MRISPPILLALAALLAACAREKPIAVTDAESPIRAQPALRPVDFVSPAIRGGQDGLEVVTLVLRDTQPQLLDALAPYLDLPLPIAPDVAQRLQSHGLRMVRMPLADLAGLEARLHPYGVRQREWIGWALDWREAFRGRAITAADRIAIDREQVSLGAGTLRLLARCWTTPIILPAEAGPEARNVVRLEMLAQHAAATPNRRPTDPDAGLDALLPPSAVFDIRSDGRVFPALSFEAALVPGQAYLLLALPPDVTTRAASTASPLEIAGLQTEKRASASAPALGPSAPLPPTLAEAMLISPSPDSAGEIRAIIALIPRAPEMREPSAQ